MADKLGITSSYLSAIENGKRDVPKDFVQKISSLYNLTEEEKARLQKAYEKTLNIVVIDVKDIDDTKRELALKFARSFSSFDDETSKKYLNFLNQEAR